ncbi:MAG: hypothetical protein K1X92_09610 [Bacteroidia bacterium]|nr:hypothetical protein [Bacteroidia bacterium]
MKYIIASHNNKYVLVLFFGCILSMMWLISAKMNTESICISEKKDNILSIDIQPINNIISVDSALTLSEKYSVVRGIIKVKYWNKSSPKRSCQISLTDENSGAAIPLSLKSTDKEWILNYLQKMENKKVILGGRIMPVANSQLPVFYINNSEQIYPVE